MNVPAITYEEYQEALKVIRQYKSQIDELQKDVSNQINDVRGFSEYHHETLFNDINISIPLYNALWSFIKNETNIKAFIDFRDLRLKHLNGVISIKKMSGYRRVGKKTIEELIELCHFSDIKLIP